MVVISHCSPSTINAYATSPLTELMTRTVQHGIYDGSQARYDNRELEVTIHDRPDFHGLSHYELCNILDGEGSSEHFLIVDAQTPRTNAVWYVPTTWECKYWSDPAHFSISPPPIVTYPDEDYVLWQGHILVADVPSSLASFSVGNTDIEEQVLDYYHPYDPHDPQEHILNIGIDWIDRREQSVMWGFLVFTANWSEVEWSTDIHDRRKWSPLPPIVAKLKDSVAREFGLISNWYSQQNLPTPGQEVTLGGYFDWNSLVWPYGYPDDPASSGHLQKPGTGKPANGSGISLDAGSCLGQNWLRRRPYKRGQLAPAGRFGTSNATFVIKQL